MSLDVWLVETGEHTCSSCGHVDRVGSGGTIFDANITHNLNRMADAAGIYVACWRPEELTDPAKTEQIRSLEAAKHWNEADAIRATLRRPLAREIAPLLREGLAKLKADPAYFETFNAQNGWGLYKHFVPWIEEYLAACEAHPDAIVQVSR